jgi:tRNA dimethylallyltransferase
LSDRGRAPLIVIAGPTASGKSAAAIAMAERIGGEIVSCDSVAVYRGFDVGAAKPDAADRARVRHHLLDVAEPEEAFTAARWVALADAVIADCRRRGAHVVVSGGTFLYLGALLGGLFDAPPPDDALRARLKQEASRLGWPALHARLATVDPEAAARIHPNDPVRIERALEVFEQTGVPISRHHAEQARAVPRHRARVFVIDPPPPAHDAAIAARTDAMLAGGLVEETARLVATRGRGLKALGALGYKEALAHLDGRLDRAQLREAIRIATRRFGKRQRTWLRKAWPPPGAAAATAGATTTWVEAAEALPADPFGGMMHDGESTECP